MVQEGCPFFPPGCTTPSNFDPWSRRNMRLSPDGGVTPAPRREGDMAAARAAYTSGIVFRGDIDIPIIDWRHYLEAELDMHHSHQSFASRQRMLNFDGRASNQVIWFTDAGRASFDQTPQALAVIDEWMANIEDKPRRGVVRNKPDGAVDSCFATNGSLLHSGRDVWDGILDEEAAGPCTQAFPLFKTSRIVAGGPDRGRHLQVRDDVGEEGGQAGSLRAVDPERGRRRPARADLPDRGLRLLEARRRAPEGLLTRSESAPRPTRPGRRPTSRTCSHPGVLRRCLRARYGRGRPKRRNTMRAVAFACPCSPPGSSSGC